MRLKDTKNLEIERSKIEDLIHSTYCTLLAIAPNSNLCDLTPAMTLGMTD